MSPGAFERLDPAAAARREAAAWVARMHAPDRSAAVDAAFRRWLEQSPLNREAFELANEVWDGVGQLPHAAASRPRLIRPLVASIAAALTLCVLGAVLFLDTSASGLSTVVGEQRTLTLEDGTRVSLNTATRIVVDYGARQRHVRLEAGEALFEVAARPDRPFVVTAGGRRIIALGTAFLVRSEPGQLAVTLVEGRVRVTAVDGPPAAGTLLEPGERLTWGGATLSMTDHPDIERLMSWREGRLMMDRTPLGEAVVELNRYSDVPLVVEDPKALAVRISGVFRVGDPLLFARAIAETYGLSIEQESGRIVLEGTPVSP